jgi:hypothetical protein
MGLCHRLFNYLWDVAIDWQHVQGKRKPRGRVLGLEKRVGISYGEILLLGQGGVM